MSLSNGTLGALNAEVVNFTQGMAGVGFDVRGTFVGTITFQGTIDGVNWLPLNVTVLGSASATAVSTATAAGAWTGKCSGVRMVRARMTAYTSGTAVVTIFNSPSSGASLSDTLATGTVTLSGTANSVQGGAAHDAVIAGNPVRIGGRAVTANYTAVATGDQADFICTTVGAQIVKLGAIPELDWQGVITITNTTSTALRAAGGAGIKVYCTGLQYQNTNATATQINILRGTTVIASYQAPASMAVPATITFLTPLQTAANEALNVQAVTTGANVLVSGQGYVSP